MNVLKYKLYRGDSIDRFRFLCKNHFQYMSVCSMFQCYSKHVTTPSNDFSNECNKILLQIDKKVRVIHISKEFGKHTVLQVKLYAFFCKVGVL